MLAIIYLIKTENKWNKYYFSSRLDSYHEIKEYTNRKNVKNVTNHCNKFADDYQTSKKLHHYHFRKNVIRSSRLQEM